VACAGNIDQEAYSNEKTAVDVISFIRRWKHDNGLALNAPLSEVVISSSAEGALSSAVDDIKGAMAIGKVSFGEAELDIGNGLKITIIK